GMTPLRIYTSWFMLVLAITFVVIIILQFREIPFWRVMFAAFTVMFALLCFGNPDRMIASYNVHAFMSGDLEEIDFSVFKELSVSAVGPLNELAQSEEFGMHQGTAINTMREILDEAGDGFAYFSIPRASAQAVLSSYATE
ncbi:MAG: DUF4153 domain-containing protein, partial [Oscillospiraceae bacterium]